MDKNHIKRAIQKLETFNHGLHCTDEADVKITNLIVRKTKPSTATVTIKFAKDGRIVKHLDVKYDLYALRSGNC